MKTIILLLVFTFLVNACISSRQSDNMSEITGISTMVGNEPFSRSAILTDKKEVYLIEGSAEIKTLLYENQGKYFTVTYNNLRDSSGLHIIYITNAIKK